MKDHQKIAMILRQRHEILEGILKHWSKGDLQSTLKSIIAIKDQNVMVDAFACTFAVQTNSEHLEKLSID